MHFEYPAGATPIDPDEAHGLKIGWVTVQLELNALEQENITAAQLWLASKRTHDVLTERFVQVLHKRMFNDVWLWAGTFRRTNKNIGVAWQQIPTQLRLLLDDTRYWCAHKTYSWDEIAARFHHRLVSIHCFPNGNGRHARLATDALCLHYGVPLFSWGADPSGLRYGEIRTAYIRSLREADAQDYGALLRFVRG